MLSSRSTFSDDMKQAFPFEIPSCGVLRFVALNKAKDVIALGPLYKGSLKTEIEDFGIFTPKEVNEILNSHL